MGPLPAFREFSAEASPGFFGRQGIIVRPRPRKAPYAFARKQEDGLRGRRPLIIEKFVKMRPVWVDYVIKILFNRNIFPLER